MYCCAPSSAIMSINPLLLRISRVRLRQTITFADIPPTDRSFLHRRYQSLRNPNPRKQIWRCKLGMNSVRIAEILGHESLPNRRDRPTLSSGRVAGSNAQRSPKRSDAARTIISALPSTDKAVLSRTRWYRRGSSWRTLKKTRA